MTRDEVKAALKADLKILKGNGREFDIDWFLGNVDYSKWKLKPNTVMVNGLEVPEPLRDKPKPDDTIYIIYPHKVVESIWRNNSLYIETLKNGAIHLTREAAQSHYDALWFPTRVK